MSKYLLVFHDSVVVVRGTVVNCLLIRWHSYQRQRRGAHRPPLRSSIATSPHHQLGRYANLPGNVLWRLCMHVHVHNNNYSESTSPTEFRFQAVVDSVNFLTKLIWDTAIRLLHSVNYFNILTYETDAVFYISFSAVVQYRANAMFRRTIRQHY